MEGDVITLQDIFHAKSPDEETAAAGHGHHLLTPLSCTGLKPHFLEKLAASGVMLPPSFFQQEGYSYRPTFAAGYGGYGRLTVRLAHLAALAVAGLLAVAPAQAAVELSTVDPSAYPNVRLKVVTPSPSSRPPSLRENGAPVTGLRAENLGRAKSVVLAFDRSRSMEGPALAEAIAQPHAPSWRSSPRTTASQSSASAPARPL